KRPISVVQDGIEGTVQDICSDFLCPICLELMKEAHIISCGHTFCRVCLEKSINNSKRCPKCNYSVYSTENIFPNHLVNQQVLKYKESLELNETMSRKSKKSLLTDLQAYVGQSSGSMRVSDLSTLISMLQEKKDQLLANSDEIKYKLLDTFLTELRRRKELQLAIINKELDIVNYDLDSIKRLLNQKCDQIVKEEGINHESDIGVPSTSNIEGFNVPVKNELPASSTSLDVRKKKVHHNFDELSKGYFTYRVPVLTDDPATSSRSEAHHVNERLDEFGNCICKFSQFSCLRTLATIDYAGDKFPASSNIASSIEFDKDGEYFAVAGLTKKIRVFDYRNIIGDVVDIHYPSSEMVCDSKISCVSWSSYLKHKLASSDYDGDVTIWDAFTAQKQHVYKEHQKRCWSVDFNKMDTKLIASGSDDACVKLWHLDSDRSITSLEAKANVCCVQFNPDSRYRLAFGSADHCVHYYDLRKMKEPLRLFKGHKKAVSYVKFISGDELVSASTDSQLKVWNVNEPNCVQSLQGHLNDKNFVGLATDGEYVACGSENNSLYVYYKDLPKKMISFRFDQRRFIVDPEAREEDSTDFVSAVCWRRGSNVLVAGNSQGIIKVLQM
ncbi:WD40 repeat, partial [Trinorchestia longiramus]